MLACPAAMALYFFRQCLIILSLGKGGGGGGGGGGGKKKRKKRGWGEGREMGDSNKLPNLPYDKAGN